MKNNTYNYDRFKASYYDLETFGGPKPSEDFPLFALKAQDGKEIDLAALNKWIVLETGSFTCPQYISNIEEMKEIREKFQDVVFIVLYVREAHPGNHIKPPKTTNEKTDMAKRAISEYKEDRLILIDEIDGHIHSKIGLRPNSIYLISPQGKVYFRSDWNVPHELERALNRRSELPYLEKDHFEPKLAHPLVALKVIMKAGFLAFYDVLKSLPELVIMHIKSKKIKKF